MLLANLHLFLTIVEKGSLIAAARETGMSTTTVSERLAALEAHYGVVLLNRTTRSINLTSEGRLLVEGAKSVLSEMSELDARIRHGTEMISGPIRLSAPVDLGHSVISEAVLDFADGHPEVRIDMSLSDGYVDLVGQGYDLAVRFGEVLESSLRLRSLGQFRRLICASPLYLKKHGVPETPKDLQEHNCLVMRFGDVLDNVWEFKSGKQRMRLMVGGTHVANDGGLIRSWALAGRGVVLKSELDVAQDIRNGALVSVLEDYLMPPKPLQMMFPPSRAQPRRVAVLAEHIARAISRLDVMTSQN